MNETTVFEQTALFLLIGAVLLAVVISLMKDLLGSSETLRERRERGGARATGRVETVQPDYPQIPPATVSRPGGYAYPVQPGYPQYDPRTVQPVYPQYQPLYPQPGYPERRNGMGEFVDALLGEMERRRYYGR